MKLKLLPSSQWPRERLILNGPEALSDVELLAILLRTGSREKNVLDLAQDLLIANHGSLSTLFTMPLSSIQKVKGIGESKAVQFKACIELAKRALTSNEHHLDLASALENIQAKTAFEQKETFYCIYLNARKKVLKVNKIASGTIDLTVIHPRDVLKTALEENASSIALVHNHPSGSIQPSKEDLNLTKTMRKLCNNLGFGLHGHFIVTPKEIAEITH